MATQGHNTDVAANFESNQNVKRLLTVEDAAVNVACSPDRAGGGALGPSLHRQYNMSSQVK